MVVLLELPVSGLVLLELHLRARWQSTAILQNFSSLGDVIYNSIEELAIELSGLVVSFLVSSLGGPGFYSKVMHQ